MNSSSSPPIAPVQKLGPEHDTEAFDCGRPELNRFLKRYALVSQKANTAQTFSIVPTHQRGKARSFNRVVEMHSG